MVRSLLVGILVLLLAVSCGDEITLQVSTSTAPPLVTTTPSPATSTLPSTTSTTAPSTTTTTPTTTMVEPIAVPLSRAEVEAWAAEVAAIPPAYVEAFDSHDMDAIRLLLADGFVFRDVGTFPVEGVDAFTRLMDQMFQAELKEMRWRVLSGFDAGFVGGDGGLMVLELWGYFGITEENPDVAVYRLATQDDLIASIDLYYRDETPHEAITKHATVWSSGDPTQVVELSDRAHTRQDTVFGIHAEGAEALSMTASSFFADHPNSVWKALMSFHGTNSRVGFFDITDTDGCVVRVAVIIQNGQGRVIYEEVYYQAATLLACGWLD